MKKHLSPALLFALLLFITLLANSVVAQNVKLQDDAAASLKKKEHAAVTKAELRKRIREAKHSKSIAREKEEGEGKKFDDPDKFAEFQKMIRTRDGESVPSYKVGYQQKELQKAIQKAGMFKSAQSLNWIERGPGNVSGRTRGIVVDTRAADHKTWFAGSVGGGIWKTTDAGANWINKSPDMPNLATTVLVQSVKNPLVFYCGTGEGFYNADAVDGGGIYKSTDGGDTWNLLAATANTNFRNINRIIVDPSDENLLLAATNEGPAGIWKSNDGGANWTRVFTASARVQDLRATPGNFSVQYATVNGDGVYKSTDGGTIWNKASTGLPTGNRYEIAISPKDNNVIFANIESTTAKMAVSKDGANTWSEVKVASGTMPDWFNGQGWYDNTMEAHPYNANSALFGGIDLWRTDLTGGQTSSTGMISIDENGTSSFLNFVNWGGAWRSGGIGKGVDFFNFSPFTSDMFHLTDTEYVAVEIRFGPGKSQKAHRFVRVSNGDYNYMDYVTVPFEVWDVTNNRQLMVSFRDWASDGAFDLITYDANNLGREYLAVNAVTYNPNGPDSNIAVNNGIVYKDIFSMWPILVSGTWNPAALPASTLKLNWGTLSTLFATFTPLTDAYGSYGKPYIHSDQHSIVVVPIDEATNSFWIINGNDGGVAYSMNSGSAWHEALNGGYNTTQFYGADKKPGADEYFGGTQDNGTWLSPRGSVANLSSVYYRAIGGDGFDVSWNYNDANKIIGGYQYNGFYRSTDGGVTWTNGQNGLADTGSGKGCFISKIAKSNSDPDVIYTTGTSGVWKSEDFGASWYNTPVSGWHFNGTSTPVAVSLAEPQVVWAGSALSSGYSYLFVSQDGGLSFSPVNKLNFSMGSITGISTHPAEQNTAYITYSFSGYPKILKTTDLGATWQDITGFSSGASTNGFPDVATYCVLVMPFNTNQIWAGTEIGLIESLDGGASWHLANNGLPAVCVWQLRIVDDQVVVATHGRGIFSVSLSQLAGYQPPSVTVSPILNSVAQSFTGPVNVNVNFRSAYDSAKVFINGTAAYTELNPAQGTRTLAVTSPGTGSVNIQVIAYKQGRSYKSLSKSLTLTTYKTAQSNYTNNFNTASTDFSGAGFSIAQPAGFNSPAINSLHPYAVNTTYTYNLLVPIIVASSNSFFEYDDIAIVEPGDAGTKFGDTAFWDYVVVEGSKDGITWTPIADGYDCRYNTRWSAIFGTSTNPDSTYYVHHKIDLQNKFAAGDQILIRFRLFSDEALTGWGWIIDNLSIQQGPLAVENNAALPKQFALMQNYPNPFNPTTTIKFALPQAENVKLEIFDSLGRLVETIVNSRLEAGYYNYKWNAGGYASGVYIYRLRAGSYTSTKKLNLVK